MNLAAWRRPLALSERRQNHTLTLRVVLIVCKVSNLADLSHHFLSQMSVAKQHFEKLSKAYGNIVAVDLVNQVRFSIKLCLFETLSAASQS